MAKVDGSVDDFFDWIYNGPHDPFNWAKETATMERHAEFVDKIWGQCIGYPEDPGCVFFRQYMHRCRINVRLPFAAYNFTINEIDIAKSNQRNLAEFVAKNQGKGPKKLHAAWKTFVEEKYLPFDSTGHLAIDKGLTDES